jgi:DNA-binding MarR family transcriptional regulator/N-acetylglutamate synthase-like GNAT family acetyltransferase
MSHVDSVRRFNRFYTNRIGVLGEGHLHSAFSLTEVRVLYELAHRERPTAAVLAADLRLDRGYLSRILQKFENDGLVRREKSADDARQSLLSLTAKGRRTFVSLNTRQHDEVDALLGPLPETERRRLVEAMTTIERVLGTAGEAKTPWLLRSPQPGDFGWVVHRHGALYAQEYGYDEHFEALVAKIVGEFVEHHDPSRERFWIAEKDGAVVGSVALVKKSATVAKLRLLYVEPSARGLGIGDRLVAECIRFARHARYRKITLWTHGQLAAARRIYEKAGFVRVAQEARHSYGLDLVDETWELAL